MLNGDKKEEIQNDSVNLRSLSPVLDERSRRSLRCCVDGVSDSPCIFATIMSDGQLELFMVGLLVAFLTRRQA